MKSWLGEKSGNGQRKIAVSFSLRKYFGINLIHLLLFSLLVTFYSQAKRDFVVCLRSPKDFYWNSCNVFSKHTND